MAPGVVGTAIATGSTLHEKTDDMGMTNREGMHVEDR
jgi:hypothetical protein